MRRAFKNGLSIRLACLAHKQKIWTPDNNAAKETTKDGLRKSALRFIRLIPCPRNFSDIDIHVLIIQYMTMQGCI